MREQYSHGKRAKGGGAPQQPKPPRPDLQDVPRIDWQQSRRPAQEHGKEVQGDRAEDHRLGADERNAGDKRGPGHCLADYRHLLPLDQTHEQCSGDEEQRTAAIDHSRPDGV